MLSKICTVQFQLTRHALVHAQRTAPTWQHDLLVRTYLVSMYHADHMHHADRYSEDHINHADRYSEDHKAHADNK